MRWAPVAVVVLLASYVILGLSASRQMSQVGDEGAHLAGGVSYWVHNDYRMQPNNGNWPQRLCGLPLWLLGYHFPSVDAAAWREMRQWDFGDLFVYGSGNDADSLLLRARTMTALLGVTLGGLVYLWSRRLFGTLGGLFSLTLYVFSNATLTHGFLATTDMANALGFTAAIGALWMLFHRVSFGTLLASWLGLSVLFLSKFSAPAIVPMGLLLMAVRLVNPAPLPMGRGRRVVQGRAAQLAVFVGLVPLLIVGVALSIWASYGFRYEMMNPALNPENASPPWHEVEFHVPIANRAVDLAREYHLLPEAYLFGFSHVMHYSEGCNAFFHGEFRRFGWLGFYPYCFVAKTPVEFFVLLAAAVLAVWFYRSAAANLESQHQPGNQGLFYNLAPLVILFVVYWGFTLANHMDAGHRYLLPTYPPLFILTGAVAWWFQPPAPSSVELSTHAPAGHTRLPVQVMRGVSACALAITVVEMLLWWPDYLPYFNLPSGGPRQAYRHLVDSSLDWSQDLKRVKPWLDAHRDDTKDRSRLYFSFFGGPPVEYYGVQAEYLTSYPFRWQPHVPAPLTGGTYLVSATMLQAVLLPYSGRWNESYEQQYQQLRPLIAAYRANADTARQAGKAVDAVPIAGMSEQQWNLACWAYDTLRFSRLASFLRAREPDEQIGYSILVYRLSDEDVARALDGPPTELLPMPEAQAEEMRRAGTVAATPPD